MKTLSDYMISEGGVVTLWYDRMDPADPPKGVKLAVCPNCRRPAVVKRREPGEKATTYIHSMIVRKRDKQVRGRCKLDDNGLGVEVVFTANPKAEAAQEAS